MFTLHCRLFLNLSSPPAHAPIPTPGPLPTVRSPGAASLVSFMNTARSRFFGNHSWVHEGRADVLAAG